ncbi:MAG: DUF188 domain-containing protein [Treponemataceae bacterium]|nr:DUF188 domain-containing protein [Treponemataceae bacterium]
MREFVFRRTKKHSIPLFFVANREIPLPAGAQMTVCEPRAQAADDYIFAHCNAGDIIITRDIPFAARLQEKSVCVMNDRGTVFSKENIGERLSERNFMLNLAEIGLGDDRKKSSYGKKEFDAFARTFDRDFSQKLMFLATRRDT